MSESLHNMDDLFKKALQDNADSPAESVWQGIDKSLDKKSAVSILRKYKRLRWAAAILLLFTSAMAVYILHLNKVNKQLVKENNNIKKTNTKEINSGNTNLPTQNSTVAAFNGNNNKPQKENGSPLKSHTDTSSNNKNIISKNITPKISSQAQNSNQPDKNIVKQEETINKRKSVLKSYYKQKLNAATGYDITSAEKETKQNFSHKEKLGKQNNFNKDNNVVETTADKEIVYMHGIPENNGPATIDNNISPISNNVKLVASVQPNAQFTKTKNTHLKSEKSIKLYFTKPSKISLTAFYSPDVSLKTVRNNHPMFRDEDEDEIKKSEWVKYASTAGIKITYNLGNNWQIGTGVSYSTINTEILPKTIYARRDNNGMLNYRFNCSAGYTFIDMNSANPTPLPGDSIQSLSSNNRLSYVNVPLYASYAFTKNRWSILPSAGMAISFLSKGQVKTNIATNTGTKNQNTTTVEGLKKTYVSGLLGVAVQYHLSKVVALSFEPSSKFGLEPINKDASVNTIISAFSFAAGVVIKL